MTVIIWWLDLQPPMQSVFITTKVVCSNPAHGKVYLTLTTFCEKVCKWLAAGLWFSPISSSSKTDRSNITEILLKVALNTIILILNQLLNNEFFSFNSVMFYYGIQIFLLPFLYSVLIGCVFKYEYKLVF